MAVLSCPLCMSYLHTCTGLPSTCLPFASQHTSCHVASSPPSHYLLTYTWEGGQSRGHGSSSLVATSRCNCCLPFCDTLHGTFSRTGSTLPSLLPPQHMGCLRYTLKQGRHSKDFLTLALKRKAWDPCHHTSLINILLCLSISWDT